MNSRGAKMKYFDEFKQAVLSNKRSFEYLAPFSLDQLFEAKFIDAKRILGTLYDNLDVM
jgi:hypothetical protein